MNRPIIGIFGRSGTRIDAIGVYYRSGVPFTLQSRSSGLYLDVTGQMNAGVGATAIQEKSTSGPHQSFLLVPVLNDGEYLLANHHTGLYLESTGATAGSTIALAAQSGADNQIWIISRSGDHCLLKNKGSGLYMDVAQASTAAGAAVHGWSQTQGNNQWWRLAPVPIKVTLFTGGGFTGSFQNLGPGSHDVGKLSIGDNAIRSIRVPEGWQVSLFQDSGFAGKKVDVTRDAAELGSISGQVSSLIVKRPPWGATIFEKIDYQGASRALSPGRYGTISGLGLGNDTLSSVKVPDGWRVTLFEEEYFGGFVTILTSDCANLKPLNANDTTSSIVVEAAPLGKVVVYADTRFKGSRRRSARAGSTSGSWKRRAGSATTG